MFVHQEGQQTHPCCAEPGDYLTTAIGAFQQAAHDDDAETADRWARLIEEIDEAPPKLAEAAQVYASWGWPVFPCLPGQKEPATPQGFHNATVDKGQIERWWKKNPRYNVAVATGHKFDAIDVDVPDGLWPWVALRDSGHLPDVHGWSATPSGGFHVLVQPNNGAGNLTALSGAVPGVDYRGLGGYILVAPSVITEHRGRRYRWAIKPSPNLK